MKCCNILLTFGSLEKSQNPLKKKKKKEKEFFYYYKVTLKQATILYDLISMLQGEMTDQKAR